MSFRSLGATLDEIVATMDERVRALERNIRRSVATELSIDIPMLPTVPPFSFSGGLVVSTSPRWYASGAMPLATVKLSLQTAGTGSSVVRLRLNGATSENFTLLSGVNVLDAVPATVVALVEGDYIDVGITTAGAAAADLDVQIGTV